MKTRATITLTPEVLEQSRSLANQRGTNVSSLIENLLNREIKRERNHVDALIGSATLREGVNGARFTTLSRKHLH